MILMKRKFVTFLLWLVVCAMTPAYANANNNPSPVGLPQVLVDIVLIRPLGFALTVSGTAVLMGMSPIIGLAAIAEPHDAFNRASDVLVVWPARFTFTRPLGQTNFPSDVSLPKQAETATSPSSPLNNKSPSQ
jgi:hypothetical protein